jgi:tetratricopeptide (TPR) repeat protein
VAVEDLPSAVEAFRKAVGFAPAEEPVFRTEAWLNLARVQFALGNDQEAYEESRRAIDAIMEKWILEEYQLHFRPHGHKLGDATLGKLYYQNAVYASRVGRREDALDALRKAILLDRRFLAAALREADWGIPRNEIVAECAERTETAIRTVGRLLGELQQAIGDHRPNIRETDLETIAAFAEGVARALPTGGYSWAMDTMRVLMEANTLVQLLAERAVLLAQKDEQTKALGDATAVAAKESAVLARRTSMAKVLSLGQMHKLSQRACLVSVILWVGLWCIIFYKMAVQWWPALGWPGHRQLYNVVYYGGLTFFAALGLLAMLAARTVGRRLSSSDRARAAAQARSAIERELRDTGSKISGLDSRVEEVAKRAGLRVARP